jgi:hypothetical protein
MNCKNVIFKPLLGFGALTNVKHLNRLLVYTLSTLSLHLRSHELFAL